MNGHSSRKTKAPRRSEKAAPPPKGAPPPGKRERILDAAVKVFAAEGFYNAKVAQIAHEAGVADGTIYLYFKSKDDLLISLFEDRMEGINANLRAALEASTNSAEKLRAVVRLHLDLIEQNRHMAEVICVELRQSSKFIKEYANPKFGEFLRLIAGAISDGQKSGELRADLDPPVIARAMFGALDELALAWLVRGKDRIDLPRTVEQMSTLFIEGLRKKE
jgi:TetR/AcrR family transcriptional regulator, fatty acid metabolism regulator protein